MPLVWGQFGSTAFAHADTKAGPPQIHIASEWGFIRISLRLLSGRELLNQLPIALGNP
jgi:hypothetical protein